MVIVDQPPDRTLVLTRLFDAPRERVFSAWSEPDQAAKWWGPQGFTILDCAMDVRPGGSWRVQMQSPDGGRYVKRGVYRQVVPPEWLVFTWTWEDSGGQPGHETLVTIRLEAEAGRTRLTLHQTVFETTAARDSHREGWTSSLQRLDGYLAAASA